MRRLAVLTLLALAACSREGTGDLSRQLCDPASMKLRNVYSSGHMTMGEVNARTPSGGMAGYRRFYIDASTGETRIVGDDWAARCPVTGGKQNG